MIYDADAEETVVCCVGFGGGNAGVLAAVRDHVGPEDFYVPVHRDIFQVLMATLDSGGSATVDSLRHALPAVDRQMLNHVLVSTYRDREALPAARLVAEMAARRRGIDAAAFAHDAFADLASDFDASLAEAKSRLTEATLPVGGSGMHPELDEFLAAEQDRSWLIDGLIGERDRIIIVAGEGSGKTTWGRQVAVQAACGLRPFEFRTPVGRKVRSLLVDCENDPADIRDEMRPMRELAGSALGPGYVRIASRPAGMDLLRREDRAWLRDGIATNRPELLVIGPLYKLHTGDPNEEGPARRVSAFLDELRSRFGFALVMEAHAPQAVGLSRRAIRPIGASLWMRWPEIGLGLERNDDGKTWRLRHWRGQRSRRAWPGSLRHGGSRSWPWMQVTDREETF